MFQSAWEYVHKLCENTVPILCERLDHLWLLCSIGPLNQLGLGITVAT